MFRFLYHFLPFVLALGLFGAWKRGGVCAREGARHTGELSLSPTIPATISVRHSTRTGSVGSL